MPKLLLIEDNLNIEGLYSLNFRVYIGVDVVAKKRAEFAVNYIEKGNSVDIIVAKATIGKENTVKVMQDFLQKEDLNIPIISLGKPRDVDPAVPTVPTGIHLKTLLGLSAKQLGITAADMAKVKVEDYFPIPINYFLEVKVAVCSIYTEDIDAPGEYIQKFAENEEISADDIKYMVSEGVAELYVEKEKRLQFVNSVSSEVISRYPFEDLSEEEQLAATETSVDLLSSKLGKIGITEETIALAKQNLTRITKNVSKNSKIKLLIGKLLENQASFRFKNMQLVTFISTHVMRHIDWGTPEQEEKLAFISFFHDIALTHDHLAKITSKDSLRKANLSSKEKELVEKHAQIAAELVHKYPHAPMGADQIIRQHHGMLNGVGFSHSFGANISPLAIVFILSERMSHMILNAELQSFNIVEAVRALRKEFSTTRFKKIIDVIETIPI